MVLYRNTRTKKKINTKTQSFQEELNIIILCKKIIISAQVTSSLFSYLISQLGLQVEADSFPLEKNVASTRLNFFAKFYPENTSVIKVGLNTLKQHFFLS